MRLVRSDDRGAVAVITAIVSLVLFGVAALTVDIGRMWETRRQAQSDADLAALAGALHLRDADTTAACKVALKFLRDNTPGGNGAASGIAADSDCTATGTADKQVEITNNRTRVTVTTPRRTVTFGMANAIGFSGGHTSATATAEIRSPGGIDPFSVATTNEFGGQCIHDNSPGHSRAITAALLSPELPMPQGTVATVTPSVVGIDEQPTVTITGSGLDKTTRVRFGSGVGLGTNLVSPNTGTQVSVTPPAVSTPIGPVDITLESGGANNPKIEGSATNAISWAYLTPVITTVTPANQPSGTTLTITGQHFGGTLPTVTFTQGGTNVLGQNVTVTSPGPNASLTNASLNVDIPSGLLGAVTITIKNGGNQTSTAAPYTIAATPAPTVTAIAPAQGPASGGTSVTITGTGFVAGTTSVTFGGTAGTAVTVAPGGKSLTVTTPAHGTGSFNVVVTTPNGNGTAPQQFTFGAAPTVSGISPNTGPSTGGTDVTITGTGFANPAVVFFGGLSATNVTVNSATSITATSPAGTSAVDVTVTTNFGTSATSNADTFTYIVGGCTGATGDFGYLDVPRNDATGANKLLQLNIILGLDHIPSIYPAPAGASAANNSTVAALPQNYKCPSDDAQAIIDPNGSPYVDGMNCLDVENGGKTSVAGEALLDGAQGFPAKLTCPGTGHTCATERGRPNIDEDSFYNYLEPGITPAQINADLLAANLAAQAIPFTDPLLTTDMDLINPDIVNCPRFTLLPVLHTDENPPNGQHAVQSFVGAYIQDFTYSGGGATPQVRTVTAITFPLNWLPGAGADSDGTIPFIGVGPVIPVLVK